MSVKLNTMLVNLLFCEPCQLGKSLALPFKFSTTHAQNPLDLIHSDMWGPHPYVLFLIINITLVDMFCYIPFQTTVSY